MSSRITDTDTATVEPQRLNTPSWAGKRVGRFRLHSELGRGAMGRVIRAEDTLLHRQVALKVLPKVLRRGSKTVAVERLISEARAAATLDHPHVVTVYEVNESGGVYYIAMELLEGGSLRDIVKAAGPMDCARACLMCADAADALAQAHALGIVHRDVKPGNLMLTRSGRCKVADFGLARVDDAGDLSVALPESVGTPQFIAPELLRGVPASARSDIYSLGATLWFLLTGHPPFEAETAAELLRQHLEAPLPDLAALRPDLPSGLVQAINRAMAKRPAERFESAAQFEKVLRIYTIPMEGTASVSINTLMSVSEPSMPEPMWVAPAGAAARQVSFNLNWLSASPIVLWSAVAGTLLLTLMLVIIVHAMHSTGGPTGPRIAAAPSASPMPANTAAITPEPIRLPVPLLSSRLAAAAQDPAMLTARGKQYTRRGEFVDAAADFDKAIQLDPTNHWNYYYRACLAAYLGQRDVYRKTCTAMFQQFSADTNAQIRDRTTKTCSLLENSGVDPKDLLKAAESLPPDGGGSPDLHAWFSLCHALALYRNGQYSQCLQTVQGAMSPQRLPRLPTAQLLEVMARWHTAPTADTYTELRQITDRTDHELPRPTVDDLGQGLNIEDWLICQIVRRQAENLIRR